MEAVRAVIFDLGSVLIGWQPQRVYQKWVRDPELRAWFLAEVARAPWDTRPVREGAFEEGLQRLADTGSPTGDMLVKYHDSMLEEMRTNSSVQGKAELLQRLSAQRVRLLAITDLPANVLPQVRAMYPATIDQLTDIIVAEEVGMRQADPGLFEYALQHFAVRAEECLYVDQSEVNMQAAQSVGIATIHFGASPPIRRQLRERGFLPPSRWDRFLRKP
jgi:2-haloacid dehalogenase